MIYSETPDLCLRTRTSRRRQQQQHRPQTDTLNWHSVPAAYIGTEGDTVANLR